MMIFGAVLVILNVYLWRDTSELRRESRIVLERQKSKKFKPHPKAEGGVALYRSHLNGNSTSAFINQHHHNGRRTLKSVRAHEGKQSQVLSNRS